MNKFGTPTINDRNNEFSCVEANCEGAIVDKEY